jgi:acid stress-induced BolA-like protein IbaG/YrbA
VIQERLPGAEVQIRDLTGTADHWQVTVVSKAFEGKPMLEQHRLIKSFFEEKIASGELHAFSLKTYTPEEWVKFGK